MIALLALFVSSARADVTIPDDVPTIAQAVEDLRQEGKSNETFRLTSEYSGDDEPESIDVTGLELRIESDDGDERTIPPLVTDATAARTTLELTRVGFTTTVSSPLGGDHPDCALCLAYTSLTLTHVSFHAVAGNGVYLYEGDVTGEDVQADETTDDASIAAYQSAFVGFVDLTDSTFTNPHAGAVVAYAFNAARPIPLTMDNVDIVGCAGGEGAAIYAYHATVTMTGGSVQRCVTAEGAPIHLNESPAVLRAVDLTGNRGSPYSVLWASLSSGTVELSSCDIEANTALSGDEIGVAQGGRLWVHGGTWAPGGRTTSAGGLWLNDETVNLQGAETNGLGTFLSVEGGDVALQGNTVCGGGASLGSFQTFLQDLSSQTEDDGFLVERNTFIGITAPDAELFAFRGDDGRALPGAASLYDNTLVGVHVAALLGGGVTSLGMVNNLFSDSTVTMAFDAVPETTVWDYSLRDDVVDETAFAWPAGVGAHDVLAPPAFVPGFSALACDTTHPATPTATSPAVDAGSPDRTDDVDGGLSDIGAVDVGPRDGGDTGGEDTGTVDTGGEDTGPEDTALVDEDGDGYAAADDCDDGDATVNPGATDIPGDDVDQDCDGSLAEISYRGGCGCNAGGGMSGLAVPLLVLGVARRRRTPR